MTIKTIYTLGEANRVMLAAGMRAASAVEGITYKDLALIYSSMVEVGAKECTTCPVLETRPIAQCPKCGYRSIL